MERNTTSGIIDEFRNLISYSIEQKTEEDKFKALHESILKKYFEAKDIKINYEEELIELKIPVSNNNYTKITFDCLDLKGFLQACLKEDPKSLRYYQVLLQEFKVLAA